MLLQDLLLKDQRSVWYAFKGDSRDFWIRQVYILLVNVFQE